MEAAYTGRWDYPEQLDVVEPHGIRERYYFTRRGPQFINRIVEIASHIDTKVRANMCNVTQGPGGHNGRRLKRRLAENGVKLPILGDDDETADFNYIKHFVLDIDSEALRLTPSDREVGRPFGLEWAERFYYRGPIPSKIAISRTCSGPRPFLRSTSTRSLQTCSCFQPERGTALPEACAIR